MWLSRAAVKANLIAEMTGRFPARHGNFPDKLKLSELGFPSKASLLRFGVELHKLPWFHGWFARSEFFDVVDHGTFGQVQGPDKPNLIDLMFNTQTRPPEH